MTLGVRFDPVLSAASEGADWAWAELYRDIAPSLLSFLRSQGCLEPEDCLGETFVHLVRGLPNFSGGEAEFRAWAFTVARSRLVDAWRSAGRRPSVPMADPEDAYVPRHVADAADQGLLARSAVEEVLSTLTADQRMVLVLRVVQQFSVEETARIIGKSEGSVKLLQHRALASLRRTLASRAQPGPLEGVPG
ncbi:MAG: hypothetical protein CVT65_03495 [Actinobacteria bacterium HGW-Actinobacteria-5]|jgi:RNA polymerase sigma-70 factor (ECF subfamily)|nr:MAG: hypothetical protein CVT65_03495 [Actinobacteria bacterium HGW-Actinobacteria-5]